VRQSQSTHSIHGDAMRNERGSVQPRPHNIHSMTFNDIKKKRRKYKYTREPRSTYCKPESDRDIFGGLPICVCGYIPIALNTHSLAICIMHAPLDAQISFPSFLFCEYNADTLTYGCVEVVHTYKMRPTPPQTFHLLYAGDIVCVCVRMCTVCV
jgi:hypothetical protein